jgi:Cu/Ag efflux protein CusF
MVRRVTTITCALALTAVTAAWAQSQDLSGRVQHIDPASRIIYFHDGRIAHLDPNAVITVDGRTVTFDQIRPGMSVIVSQAPAGRTTTITAAPATVVTAPSAVSAWQHHPPVDASGVVATIDAQSGLVTFQDGRVFRITSQSRVWEQGRLSGVRPGDQVFVSGAQPAGYQSSAVGATSGTTVIASQPGAGSQQYMGTVVGVDQGKTQIMLSDGRIVRVKPTTRMIMGDRSATLAELRPGDQLVIAVSDPAVSSPQVRTQPGTVTIERDGSSALPRQDPWPAAVLDASEVRIMRRPQSP